jgi:galactose mutarotase-like enzyme
MNINLPEPHRTAAVPNLSHPLDRSTVVKVAAGEFRIARHLLTDGASQDAELILIDSGVVRAALCPTRGMSLWKANINGDDLGWKSPIEGPVHPNYVPLDEPGGLGWLDGFDELLVRCGLRSFGAPDFGPQGQLTFPLHGRIGNLPARQVRIESDPEHSLLHIHGEVHESRFLQYNLRLHTITTFAIGEPKIAIHDRVINAGATPTTMQLLYHINIGAPQLEAGSKLYLAADKVVARNARAAENLADWQTYLAPTAGYAEQVYFSASRADASGWAKSLLASRSGERGVAVHYRPESLPYFTQWKNTVAESDGYVTGLEPGTGFPNPRSFEEQQGRVVQLAAGEAKEFRLAIEGIQTGDRVKALQREIATTNGGQVATSDFEPNWCMARS